MKTLISFIILTAFTFCSFSALSAVQTDSQIEDAVKNSYTFKNYLKDMDIKVESKNAIVILTGTVPDEYHKLLAKDTVINLPGVKGVKDRLQIKEDESGGYADRWLAMKVKAVLLFHRSSNVFTTDVESKNGVITISGKANSIAQKGLVTKLSEDVKGVKKVINKMTVE